MLFVIWLFDYEEFEVRLIEFKRWQFTEHPSIKKQFEKWLELQESDPEEWGSCDFLAKGIELRFRNWTNGIQSNCMTIATVRLPLEYQNKGVFKSLLNYVVKQSPWDLVAIEDVENSNLRDFCLRNGFKQISSMYPTSFYINKNELCEFSVERFNY